jgi:hypothetical protein
MPQSEVRARTLRSFIEFLRESDADRDRRALWFAILNRLLDAARGTERRTILATFEDSGNPVLALYARLDRLASRRSD